jgi:ribosome-associated toxin RatA of RatAB toxin-antitoxin module
MTRIDRSALLHYSAEDMFALVNDIEAYPVFMKGCVGAQVLSRASDTIEARLDLARGGIKQSFVTRNTLRAPEEILLQLVDGPFETFEGKWGFQKLKEDACKVTLELSFSMSNSLVGKAAKKLFEPVATNLVDALCKRAKEVYGA